MVSKERWIAVSIVLRILLIVGSLVFATNTMRKIRASTIEIGDALFWIIFSFFLLLISFFPRIVFFTAELIGIQSPVNMVFLSIIALLAYKSFSLSIKVSALSMKQKMLTATLATQQAIETERLESMDPAHGVAQEDSAESHERTPLMSGAENETSF